MSNKDYPDLAYNWKDDLFHLCLIPILFFTGIIYVRKNRHIHKKEAVGHMEDRVMYQCECGARWSS